MIETMIKLLPIDVSSIDSSTTLSSFPEQGNTNTKDSNETQDNALTKAYLTNGASGSRKKSAGAHAFQLSSNYNKDTGPFHSKTSVTEQKVDMEKLSRDVDDDNNDNDKIDNERQMFIPQGNKLLISRGTQSQWNTIPKSVPAKFEGIMMVPMHFDGLTLTPESLMQLLSNAEEVRGSPDVPVLFKTTSLNKTFLERISDGISGPGKLQNYMEPLRVQFEGFLKDILDPSWSSKGIPILLDGRIIC